MPSPRLAIFALALICLPRPPMAQAQGASAWDTGMHSAARLIAGMPLSVGDAALLRAGVQIRLDPGWHTYWRYPGDSGVPPTFDFAGSENIKSVTVLWPAPVRFPDGAGGKSIGYVSDVTLPLRIEPGDSGKLSILRLKLDYAVCENLCIPAKADLSLPLSDAIGANEKTLVAAEAHIPRREPLGTADSLAIRSIQREAQDGPVVVEVTAPAGTSVDMFVEGPTPEWSLPLPEPNPTMAAIRRFTFDLDGMPPGANAKGVPLTSTVVSPGGSIEVVAPLE